MIPFLDGIHNLTTLDLVFFQQFFHIIGAMVEAHDDNRVNIITTIQCRAICQRSPLYEQRKNQTISEGEGSWFVNVVYANKLL